MLRLNNSFEYVYCKTLTGKKLLAGDVSINSYIKINKQDEHVFLSLINKIKNNKIVNIDDLVGNEKKIAIDLYNKGYLNNTSKPSFNEINTFSKILLTKEFKPKKISKKKYYFRSIVYFIIIALLITYICMNADNLITNINYESLSIFNSIILIIIMPAFIIAVHEFGHFAVSLLLGIKPSSIKAGFFVIYPVVYLTYNGLSINNTLKKLSILSGGIASHILGMAIGVFFILHGFNNIFIQIFIVANLSMVFSNITILGASDGYFIFSNILGIYNLRLSGYKGIKKFLKNKNPSHYELMCGVILVLLWILSFVNLFIGISVFFSYLSIPNIIIKLISILILLLLGIRFVLKIFKLQVG